MRLAPRQPLKPRQQLARDFPRAELLDELVVVASGRQGTGRVSDRSSSKGNARGRGGMGNSHLHGLALGVNLALDVPGCDHLGLALALGGLGGQRGGNGRGRGRGRGDGAGCAARAKKAKKRRKR